MFNNKENDLIDFGKFTVYQSLKEMADDEENLNNIEFDELVEATIRDIEDSMLQDIIKAIMSGKYDKLKDWRKGLR